MKQPMNRNAAAVMKPTLVMPPPHAATALTTSCGMWKYASIQPNADAVPMQNSAMPANRAESYSVCLSCFKSSVR